MKVIHLLTAVTISVAIFSCKKNVDVVASGNAVAKTMLNVSYGADPLENMDVYLPTNRSVTTTKVLIMIHGGAWESGDKTDLTSYVDTMKNRLPGYAIFNINYRLSVNSINVFPAQENDVKAAFDFIMNKAADYIISQKVVLLGVSAGGHLALLQGYKYDSNVKPEAIVSFFGPTDLIDMYNNPASPIVSSSLLASIIGTTPSQDSLLYANSSPINFVSSSSPPTILLHGGLDLLVRPQQAMSLQSKLQASGVINEFVFYPTEGHGWTDANLTDSFDKIQAFLSANVQ
ncbi:MAG: alpha/beta hydrolase [Bacteroidota bacterium]|nr:alpha/beta hydrolase [Bacteroidota bacterium]